MKSLLFIFIGGGVGSVLRYLVSGYTQKLWTVSAFPMGTFAVNMIGCLLIGIFSAYFVKADDHLRMLMVTGFCGGFTTFSALSSENIELWQTGAYAILIIYVLLSVILGLAMVYAGYNLVKS